MRIWIDLANSPHAPFFAPVIDALTQRGAEISVSARDFAQTLELACLHGIEATPIGVHGGKRTAGKARAGADRSLALRRFARERRADLALGHNSYSQIVAAFLAGIPAVTLMDYEHTPANHLAFRLAHRVMLPEAIPASAVRRYGCGPQKIVHYPGFKEQAYLDGFLPGTVESMTHAIPREVFDRIVIVARPPADFAVYHRFANPLFERWLAAAGRDDGVRIVLLPRTPAQRERATALRLPSVVIPTAAVDGATLLHHADLAVSAGGTMNREAAVLGTPAVSLFAGEPARVDLELERQGRLVRIREERDLLRIEARKKVPGRRMPPSGLSAFVADYVAGLVVAA